MSMTDPIADMLTRIRNAGMARHKEVLVTPCSKMKVAIASILKEEGYIEDFRIIDEGKGKSSLLIKLKYIDGKKPFISGLKRISKPGRRVYVGKDEIPKVLGGLGIVILSTSKGVMTGEEAKRIGVGGEVVAYIW